MGPDILAIVAAGGGVCIAIITAAVAWFAYSKGHEHGTMVERLRWTEAERDAVTSAAEASEGSLDSFQRDSDAVDSADTDDLISRLQDDPAVS